MRLQLLLPKVEPKEISIPPECVHEGCGSKEVQMHQSVVKPLRDTKYTSVEVYRYRCLKCGRTFRVYPKGVSNAQVSDRVKGLAVMLYLLGLEPGSSLASIREFGGTSLQDGSLRDSASCRQKDSGYETRAGLWGNANESRRRRFDECEMCCSRGCI